MLMSIMASVKVREKILVAIFFIFFLKNKLFTELMS
jgi:hypothetical protein